MQSKLSVLRSMAILIAASVYPSVLSAQQVETSGWTIGEPTWFSDLPPTDLPWPAKAYYCERKGRVLSDLDFVNHLIETTPLEGELAEFAVNTAEDYWNAVVLKPDAFAEDKTKLIETPRVHAVVRRFDDYAETSSRMLAIGVVPIVSVQVWIYSEDGSGTGLNLSDLMNHCAERGYEYPPSFF